jgi:hypothetical protein
MHKTPHDNQLCKTNMSAAHACHCRHVSAQTVHSMTYQYAIYSTPMQLQARPKHLQYMCTKRNAATSSSPWKQPGEDLRHSEKPLLHCTPSQPCSMPCSEHPLLAYQQHVRCRPSPPATVHMYVAAVVLVQVPITSYEPQQGTCGPVQALVAAVAAASTTLDANRWRPTPRKHTGVRMHTPLVAPLRLSLVIQPPTVPGPSACNMLALRTTHVRLCQPWRCDICLSHHNHWARADETCCLSEDGFGYSVPCSMLTPWHGQTQACHCCRHRRQLRGRNQHHQELQ